ncbi:glycogen debranching enzyme, putative [Synechococcus sp. PCC 7502]|uniref:amylo-alpha-1,6-glucosidase n=1 Tax=Synechococcus sp. PCC 7502 TaxID=1173263 RepID=UPI00029F9138|nr:amylo-alpha-1,6-glucosidase [Synechococcus sp. PCC 7502]AFY75086.1 glycogen debranching enzyme, putative [Synechococcus sp. PCC 7502]
MTIEFGREVCGDRSLAEKYEWLVTNGIGGYASGTISGTLTRRYHGLLIAALNPPLERSLLVTKLDETIEYQSHLYPLHTNRWADGTINPLGYLNIESFTLEGTIPRWNYACADALLQKRVWMEHGENTTYIQYYLERATAPITLTIKALVNYRDYHHTTVANNWQMQLDVLGQEVCIRAFSSAMPFYLFSDRGNLSIHHDWYKGFDLAIERERGLGNYEDHLHAVTFTVELNMGETLILTASTEVNALDKSKHYGKSALQSQSDREAKLLETFYSADYLKINTQSAPSWIKHIVLAANQFIVERPQRFSQLSEGTNRTNGKTIIAGYHWFSDWGRDTMISLPGLTLATGHPEIARSIIITFAQYLDQGMLPNRFPDQGEQPEYNTVDATLWYFEAIRSYHAVTQDDQLLAQLFPALEEIIDWHCRGTRYNIHVDSDGLLYAGEDSVQLTWMDAKVGDWVVTPRIGKPIEINVLWYCALTTMTAIAQRLGKPHELYENLAEHTRIGFQQFWHESKGYCYDVLNTDGNDDSLRPNQIFAVALPKSPLLTSSQQKSIVDVCGRSLLTSYGLRSLSPNHPQYCGYYEGDSLQRDSCYHQGTVWGWLLGAYIRAHLRIYQNPDQAYKLLQPMSHHLKSIGIGSLSEIFDGNAPMTAKGCIAQAWTVAEVLQTWVAIKRSRT